MGDSASRPGFQPRQNIALGTVLVVGGCGFLGTALVDQLLNFPSERQHPDYDPRTGITTISLGPNRGRYAYQFPSKASRYSSFDQNKTKVHVVDLKCSRNRLPGAVYHEADITEEAAVLEVLRQSKPDVIINTVSPSYDLPRHILRKVNVDGTRLLLEAAAGERGDWGGRCQAFVHTSSSSVIHDALSAMKNWDERWPYICPNPREYYSETKALAERIVLSYNDHNGMKTAAVRPAGIGGEGDMAGITHGPIMTAASKGLGSLHMQIGRGDNMFDVTYVGNVAMALLMVAEGLLLTVQRQKEGKPEVLDHERIEGEAFVCTNDSPTYFWQMMQFMYSRYGREIDGAKIRVLPGAMAWLVGAVLEAVGAVSGNPGRMNRQTIKYSLMDRYLSCEKLKRRVGYEPVVSTEEGIARAVDSYKRREAAGENVSRSGKGDVHVKT